MIITGNAIYNHFSHPCPYRVHLDLFGDKTERTAPGAAGRYLMERGNRHEARVFADLMEKHPDDCVVIDRDESLDRHEDIERRIEATTAAMKRGVRYIMHGFITSEPGDFEVFHHGKGATPSPFTFRGETDLLERRDDIESEFGSYAYVVGDVKSSRHAKLGQKMQVAFYSTILEKRQGVLPPTGFIVTGHGQREEFSIKDLQWTLRLFLEEELHECLDEENVSFHFSPRCRFCHWRGHCEKKAGRQDDLSLVPGCRPAEKRALIAAGIPDRTTLLSHSESDLRDLGRRFGNRLDGFRDLKQKAGAQQFGMPIMRQDPRSSAVGHTPGGVQAPCVFRHRGPLLLVDSVPDRFHGDEALLAFGLVRPRNSDDGEVTCSFLAAAEPGDGVSALRSLFIELNNANKLLQPTRERALMVFVDAALPYRLRRQAGALWRRHGSAPISVERLLAESAVLTDVVQRTWHLPIDAFDLDALHRSLSRRADTPTMRTPMDSEGLAQYCASLPESVSAESVLDRFLSVLDEYGIEHTLAQEAGHEDFQAVAVREWRETGEDAFQIIMQFGLRERLAKAQAILKHLAGLGV